MEEPHSKNAVPDFSLVYRKIDALHDSLGPEWIQDRLDDIRNELTSLQESYRCASEREFRADIALRLMEILDRATGSTPATMEELTTRMSWIMKTAKENP